MEVIDLSYLPENDSDDDVVVVSNPSTPRKKKRKASTQTHLTATANGDAPAQPRFTDDQHETLKQAHLQSIVRCPDNPYLAWLITVPKLEVARLRHRCDVLEKAQLLAQSDEARLTEVRMYRNPSRL